MHFRWASQRPRSTTATRDLQDLVDKGALKRSGPLRFTRFTLHWKQFFD